MTTCTAKTIISIMSGWVGLSRSNKTHKVIIDTYNSYKPLARGYKATYTDDYCDITVSAAFIKAKAVNLIGGTECGVEKHIAIFKNKGIWIEDGTITPKVGDICCYNWDDKTQPNNGPADHIGIVESVNTTKKTFTVIEGNMTGGKVGRRIVKIGYGCIRGFARPKYDVKTVTKPSTSKKSVTEIAKEVLAGKWGNGTTRKEKLTAAGYNYAAVQKEVSRLANGTQKKSVTEIAKEVIAGKWGNGTNRKEKLTAAGYNYSAVQKEVNRLIKLQNK